MGRGKDWTAVGLLLLTVITLAPTSATDYVEHTSRAAEATTSTTGTLTDCTGEPADVIFIVDASASEALEGFKRQMKFVANIIRLLDIGPSRTQIGVIQYYTYDKVQFDLDDHSSKDSVLNALAKIDFPSGASYTGDALQSARTLPGRRENAWLAVVVLSDGQSSDRNQTEHEASALRSTGALVMAVGIGRDLGGNELDLIATDTAHVFDATSTDFPSTIEHQIAEEIKCADRKWVSQVCQGTEAADIILFLDASGQGGQYNFDTMVTFASSLVEGFSIGHDRMQFSVVSYAEKASGDIWFNSYPSKAELLQGLKTLRVSPGVSDLDAALTFAREYAYARFHGDRPRIPNYAIMVTDSVSQDVNEAIRQATELKRRYHVEMMTVGVGDRVDRAELQAIASDPSGVFQVPDDTHLRQLHDTIRRRICEDLNPSSTHYNPLVG